MFKPCNSYVQTLLFLCSNLTILMFKPSYSYVQTLLFLCSNLTIHMFENKWMLNGELSSTVWAHDKCINWMNVFFHYIYIYIYIHKYIHNERIYIHTYIYIYIYPFKGTFRSWTWCTRNVIKISLLTRKSRNLYPNKVLYPKYYKNIYHQYTKEAK